MNLNISVRRPTKETRTRENETNTVITIVILSKFGYSLIPVLSYPYTINSIDHTYH